MHESCLQMPDLEVEQQVKIYLNRRSQLHLAKSGVQFWMYKCNVATLPTAVPVCLWVANTVACN